MQTMKKGLRKFCLDNKASGWERILPYMVMRFNKSLPNFLPYFLLYSK